MSDQRKESVKDNLAKTRLKLRTLLMRLSEEQWNATVYHDDVPWTVVQLVRHLVDAEQGHQTNIGRIREGGSGVPEDFDLSRWNRSRVKKMGEIGPKELMAELARNRARTLEILDEMADEDWAKEGRHPMGVVKDLEGFFNRIWEHESEHTADIAEAVGMAANKT